MSVKVWQSFLTNDKYIYINRTRIKKVFTNQIQFIDNELIDFNNAKKLVKKVSCNSYHDDEFCNKNYIICSKTEDNYEELLGIERPSKSDEILSESGEVASSLFELLWGTIVYVYIAAFALGCLFCLGGLLS